MPSASSRAAAAPRSPLRRARRWHSSLLAKPTLIIALGNLPIAFVGYKFFSVSLDAIAVAEREHAGVRYLADIWPVYGASLQGRVPSESEVARASAAALRFDELLGTGFHSGRFLEASRVGGADAVTAGRNLIGRIADNANLSVDPDLNTLNAIAIVAAKLPEVGESALTLLQDLGGAADIQTRHAALDRFERAGNLLYESLGATDALNFNTELTARLGAAQANLYRATTRFLAVASTTPPDLPINEDAASPIGAAHAVFQQALSEFWGSANQALDVLLANRIAHLQGVLGREIAVAIGLYVLVGLLIWWLAWSMSRRTRSLMRVVDDMRDGHLDQAVPHTNKRDEIGDIARAVEVFRTGLLDKRVADEALLRRNRTLQEQRAELETKNIRFDAALNNMRHGLAMFDSNDRLAVWNQRFAAIYDLPQALLTPGTPRAAILGPYRRPRPGEGRGRLAHRPVAPRWRRRFPPGAPGRARRLRQSRRNARWRPCHDP